MTITVYLLEGTLWRWELRLQRGDLLRAGVAYSKWGATQIASDVKLKLETKYDQTRDI